MSESEPKLSVIKSESSAKIKRVRKDKDKKKKPSRKPSRAGNLDEEVHEFKDKKKSKNKLRLSSSISSPSLSKLLQECEEAKQQNKESIDGFTTMRRASPMKPKPMTKAAALDLSMFKVKMGSSGLINTDQLDEIKDSKKENQSNSPNHEQTNNNSKHNNNNNSNNSGTKLHLYQRVVTISATYAAKDDTELQLQVGDKVKLRGLPEYGWVEGEIEGRVGWFPISSSKELEEIIDEASKQIDSSLEISEKLKTMNFFSGYFSRRIKDNDVFLPVTNTPGEKFQFEIEKRKKAEIINNHLSMRANQNFNEYRAEAHFDMNDMTETNIVYESSDDEEDKIDFSQEEEAISLFTTKPQKAIDLLIANKIVVNEPKAIADYLFTNPKLDKTAIGDFLGTKDDYNQAILDHFLSNLNFKGLEFDESLRKFLLTFKLPGEAQKIDRIMEGFARRYYSLYGGNLFANQDTAYILAFSVIMLNTDLHNPSIKKKMTVEEFIKNQRGINNGKDLPRVFLEDLYHRIREEKIQMEDCTYPNALKRGYLSRERHAKVYQKVWCILDVPSTSFYIFKSETEMRPLQTFDIRSLVLERQQLKLSKKKQLFPISLTFKDEKIKLFATSQRIWVDWLSAFNSVADLSSLSSSSSSVTNSSSALSSSANLLSPHNANNNNNSVTPTPSPTPLSKTKSKNKSILNNHHINNKEKEKDKCPPSPRHE